jgi:hypothetical protein
MQDLLLAINLTGVLASLVYIYRNGAVAKERYRVIEVISELAREDILAGRDFEWRYREFESISYGYMLFIFFRPVGLFYRDMACMKSGCHNNLNGGIV